MTVPTFSALLTEYLNRAGISDSELARSIGVRRQTVFRWKEGLVERPRAREDVLRCARKLRLTDEERDLLLLAAGFAPQELSADAIRESLGGATDAMAPPTLALDEGTDASAELGADNDASSAVEAMPDDSSLRGPDTRSTLDNDPAQRAVLTTGYLPEPPATAATVQGEPWHNTAPETPGNSVPPKADRPAAKVERRWQYPNSRYLALGLITLLVLFTLLFWRIVPWRTIPVTPIATAAVVQVTLNAPVSTAASAFPAIHPTAQPGEILLLVAPFDGYTVNEQYNVAGRLQEALADEIANARLISTTIEIWPEKIRNRAYLAQVLTSSNAALVIWGEYDSGRVRVNLDGISHVTEKRDFPLSSPTELITTISNTLPKEIRMLALTALGRLLRNQGESARATAIFTRALDLEPGDPKTRALLNFYLGYLADRGGQLSDLSQAIRYYNDALAENPLLYDAQYNLGTVYLNRSYLHPADDPAIRTDLDAAIANLTTVISVRPAYRVAYQNRGVAHYERNLDGDLAEAQTDFSRVIAADAQNSRAYFHRALTAVRAGEGQAWVGDFQKTLALEPSYYPAYNGLCWGYALAQQAETGRPFCDQAVALDPTGASRDSRGIVYAQLARYADAATEFTAYLDWLKAKVEPTLYARYRGPLVEEWIVALHQGENPFTQEVLDSLR